jgi:microcystin-dependent protein
MNTKNYDLVFLIVLLMIIIYNYCNCNIKEHFDDSTVDDSTVYDVESNRNLASIANKIMTPNGLDVRGNINFAGMIKVNGTDILPIGSIIAFSSDDLPPGWVWCNGGDISKGYPELVAVLGKTSLPDLRGRAIIGAGQGVGLTNRPLNSTGGEATHKLTVNEMPSHTHSLNDISHTHNYEQAVTGVCCNNRGCSNDTAQLNSFNYPNTSAAGNHSHTMNNNGGNQAHNNMQAYLGLNYIIRAF